MLRMRKMMGLKITYSKISHSKLAVIGGVTSSLLSLGMYFSFVNRWLPFLKNDTVFTAGRYVATEIFIANLAPMFLYMMPAFICVGIINYAILRRRERIKEQTIQ